MSGIEVKDLGFPSSIKQRVEKCLPTKSLDITCIKGQVVTFNNTNISVGQIIEAGAKLGTDTIKTTGNSTGLHLHFAIYVGGDYVDPTPYLQGSKSLSPYKSAMSTPSLPNKNVDELAKEVIKGDWGNNPERKQRLEASGYNYSAVQARVNEILSGNSASAPATTSVSKYTVKRGDTLSSIARNCGTTWQTIYNKNQALIDRDAKAHGVKSNFYNYIYVGQELFI